MKKGNIKLIIKNSRGYTLIEIMAAIAIFTVLMMSVTQIFGAVVKGQRSAAVSQNTQESMRFAFEVISKELRTAKNFVGTGVGCNTYFNDQGISLQSPINKIYNSDDSGGNNSIYFRNKNNLCVSYSLENNSGTTRLKITREDPNDGDPVVSDYITPDDIKVDNLRFDIVDNRIGDDKAFEPRVTIRMDVEAVNSGNLNGQKMNIQTTISSRNYNEF